MVYVLLACGPFATLMLAAGMRIVSALQPETPGSDGRRVLLNWSSYALLVISIVGMVFLVFAGGPSGVAGLFFAAIFTGSIIEAEVRIAGVRNRARQVEFLWVLAMAVKSKRPLDEEIESYAQGTWGSRHRRLIQMADRLYDGVPLTEIAVPQGLLPHSALMQIYVGASSKSLEEALYSTALRYTQQLSEDQTAPHPGSAFLYPAAVLPVLTIVVGFLMYYIIPKFKRIFDDFGTELPG